MLAPIIHVWSWSDDASGAGAQKWRRPAIGIGLAYLFAFILGLIKEF